jgi:hypothetical protein
MRLLAERFNGGDMRGAVLGCVLAAVMAMPAIGLAQWLKIPTQGVPRNADGTPNLKAPAPRLPDGKPDFSGIWHAGNRRPCVPGTGEFIACDSEIGASRLSRDLGADSPGGLPYLPAARKLWEERKADDGRDDPHVRCLPDNPPRHWNLPHLSRLIHTPKLLAILYEVNAQYRQIHIDGRPLPADMNPSWMGYSTSRWEGDTLVVRTEGFRDGLWADMNGSPMGSATKMTERISRPNYGTLEIELTIDDPKHYSRPFTVKLVQLIELDTEIVDEICLEGEQSYERMIRSRGK